MAKQYTDEEILAYKTKDATGVQKRYSAWLKDKLELEFATPKAEAAFDEAVRIATALRMIFQASPENQEVRADAKSEREEAQAAKSSKKSAKASDDDEDEAPAKPKTAAKPAKAAKSTKAAPPPADDDDEDEPATVTGPKKSAPKKAARSGSASAPF